MLLNFFKINSREGILYTLRKTECILNGQFHVRQSHLCLDASILELYHGVDNALRMYYHFNLIGLQVEQPFGLNHFQSFVHKRGRIYTDLGAHTPVRMLQSMFSFYIYQVIGLSAEERSARSS